MIKDFLSNKNNFIQDNIRKHIKCSDGFIFSIQASSIHECIPKADLEDGNYTEVEVACCYQRKLAPYSSGIVYKNPSIKSNNASKENNIILYYKVPVFLMNELIQEHGGISSTINT